MNNFFGKLYIFNLYKFDFSAVFIYKRTRHVNKQWDEW